jgi:hypothetical protein
MAWGVPAAPLDADILAALDPGIRTTVLTLRAAGFETTDSGDGVSKPAEWYAAGEALRYPHVACVISRKDCFSEADRMAEILGADWHVEASYTPGGPVLLFARFEN